MNKLECDVNAHDTSDTDDSDDNEENETELNNIKLFKCQIEENPLNYDAHVNLIKCYRTIGELEDLRRSRESMNQIYPLTPELWMDWVSDEQKICTTDEERSYVIKLFNCSVKEYMNVQIWVEYIMFMLGGGKMDKTREVCEEALTAVGIHLAEGILVWQSVILVEQQFFLSLPEDSKESEEQKKKIQNIFRRQARVPLMNQNKEEFLTEAEKWFDGNIDSQMKKDLDSSYKKMLEKMPFEEALLRASDETEKLEAYRKYIDFVRASDNPAVIQNIYERTVTELCLNAGIWEEYVRFVMEQFSSANYVVLPVCERSQANCPWSSALFELHITALQIFAEIIGEEETRLRIKKALEKTLQSGVMNEVELIKIWMAYLVYLRRKIKWEDEEPSSSLMEFREACDQAITYIDERLGEEGDRECTIARFQARVEAESAKNIEAARALWNDHILKRNNNFKVANLWIEFLNLERCFGSEKHCRKLYRRALERNWDEVEIIGSSFLQFEQELGTLETMNDFDKRYKDRILVVQKKRMENTLKEEQKKEQFGKTSKGKSKFRDEKTIPLQSPEKHSPKSKRSQETHEDFSSPPAPSSKGMKRTISEVETMDAPPPGYKKPRKESDNDSKIQKVTEHGEFVRHDSSLDYRSVFLSNMDYTCNDGHILSVFSDCGSVESFRTAKDFKGRSKGFGYLVFADAASVPKALSKDRTPVNGRPLFVSRCNPKSRDHAFKFSTGIEKEKLFVRGLPFSMNEDAVKTSFEPHGKIKSFRLVTHRNGYSKGTCYIEYHDAETAEKVRHIMDGTMLDNHKISVYISNPSQKPNKAGGTSFSSTSESSFASTPGSSGYSNTQKPKLGLLPRSLIRSQANSNRETPTPTPSTSLNGNSNASESNGTQNAERKSNEDFRKMFLGN